MKWFDRSFEPGQPLWMLPNVVERLRGTPARLEEAVRGLSPAQRIQAPDGGWSIQEHVGHLFDLEELWSGRLEDFGAGSARLRPADLDNRKTVEANHNAGSMHTLLVDFRAARGALVAAIEEAPTGMLLATALHPRLNQPMSVCDLAFFVAEHDDHHLAHVTRLRRLVGA